MIRRKKSTEVDLRMWGRSRQVPRPQYDGSFVGPRPDYVTTPPLRGILLLCCNNAHSRCTHCIEEDQMSRLPTASLRRPATPSHHGSGSSQSPRHSRAFQDADSEPESGNSSEGSVKGEVVSTSPKPSASPPVDKVTLLVAGKRFTVSPSLFTKHPETMLGR